MKKALVALISIGLFMSSLSLLAGTQHEVNGVIKDIKVSQKKLTISHGPIKDLGMDGMTMDFAVYDPAMLEGVKKGHNVVFMLEMDKSGNMMIMDIEDKGKAAGSAGEMADGSENHEHEHEHHQH